MSDDTWCRDRHTPCSIEHQHYSRAMGEECCIPTCDRPCCKPIIFVEANKWWPLPWPVEHHGKYLIIHETNGFVIRPHIVDIVKLGRPPKKISSPIPIAKVVRLRGVAT